MSLFEYTTVAYDDTDEVQKNPKVQALCVLALAGAAWGARARPRLRQDDDDAVYYDPRAQDRAAGDQVVLVSADEYDALYRANDRLDESEYGPRGLGAVRRPPPAPPKESSKQPPVQTIKNYNKVNDDGSFTFGYEAADGSFKEETRGTDCVVRGKYGYIDPDGNKREFTYVSGNPCDPNQPNEDDERDGPTAESDERDDPEPNYPAQRPAPNYPTQRPAHRPAAPAPLPHPRPPQPRPQPVALFQNDFRDADEEESDDEPPQPVRPRVVQRPALRRPAPAYRQQIAITPRPLAATTPRPLPPATTFRPQLLQLTASPQPQYSAEPTYSPSPAAVGTTTRPGQIDFAAEFAKFHRENQLQSTTSSNLDDGTKASGASPAPGAPTGNPLYSTELVYDPSSGQYDTQLYQTLPQTKGELNLNQRLQPFVARPQAQLQPRPFVPSPQISPVAKTPLYRHQIQHSNPQELYQRQQQEAQFQNSAQLFAQQQQLQQSQLQRDRAAARAQAQRLALAQAQQAQAVHASAAPEPAPQFYYVAGRDGESPSSGQIDAFLRGHGIQF